MTTLFYKALTGLSDWTTYGPIDRLGTDGWGATITMSPSSSGTMEMEPRACTDATGLVCTSCCGGSTDMLVEGFPWGGPGQSVRFEAPAVNGWKPAPSHTTHPYFFVQLRTTFGTGVWNGSVEIDDGGGPSSPCAYGVELNPDATYYELITDSLIDLVVGLALFGTGQEPLIPYVEAALAALEGSIFVGVDCSTLPGAGPTLDFPNLSTLSTATLLAWFQSAAWHFFCRCIPGPPGSADPIPPEPPPIIPPTLVVPVQPGPICDNTDLCSYLAGMKAQLQAITAQLSYLRTDVRLIERQHVPFGYVLGTLHSGLTGAGQFSVSGILAVAVEVTTIPGASGEEAGDPLARFGLGWVTTGTADGWRKSVPIRHNPMWIDAEFDDTVVGYSLAPLVVANIREISRQP